MFDTLVISSFLDPDVTRRISQELESSPAVSAGVYGGGSDPRVELRTRQAELVRPRPDTIDLVSRRLRDTQEMMSAHFQVTLTEFETPQFNRYPTGGFFVAHQDGNTPLIRDESLQRRVSVVIFLSNRSDYGGGELTLYGRYPNYDQRYVVPAEAGALVAFRSETTHEVTPVTFGTRYTIVCWYRE